MKNPAVLLTSLLVAIAVSACSTTDASETKTAYDPRNPYTWTQDQLFEDALAVAAAENASPEQVVLIEEARAAGEVSFNVVQSAYTNVMACFDDLGIEHSQLSEYNSQGVRRPYYTYSIPFSQPELELLAEDCLNRHGEILMSVYDHQPTSRDAIFPILQANRPTLEQCLLDSGLQEDVTSFTIGELWDYVQFQSYFPEEYGMTNNVDCLMSIGVNW